MIKLTALIGSDLWLNPDAIAMVRVEDGRTAVYILDGSSWTVQETPEQIRTQMHTAWYIRNHG